MTSAPSFTTSTRGAATIALNRPEMPIPAGALVQGGCADARRAAGTSPS
jgi:hypothetical protein